MFSFLMGKCLEIETLGHRRGICEPYKKLLGSFPNTVVQFLWPYKQRIQVRDSRYDNLVFLSQSQGHVLTSVSGLAGYSNWIP